MPSDDLIHDVDELDMTIDGGVQRRQHKGPKSCLHCLVWEAIQTYHKDAGLIDPMSGLYTYDIRVILGSVGDVIAELVAGIPARPVRRNYLDVFNDHIRRRIPEVIASGQAVPARPKPMVC